MVTDLSATWKKFRKTRNYEKYMIMINVMKEQKYQETYTRVTSKIFKVHCPFKTFHIRLFWNQEEGILLQRCLEGIIT